MSLIDLEDFEPTTYDPKSDIERKVKDALEYGEKSKIIGDSAWEKNMSKLISTICTKISEGDLTEQEIDMLCEQIREKYKRCQYDNGTFIGTRIAQDITQPITQSKLSSFYTVGLGKESHDVIGSYKKLLASTTGIKESVCKVFFKHLRTIEDVSKKLSMFVYQELGDFVEEFEMLMQLKEVENAGYLGIEEEHLPALVIKFRKDNMSEYNIGISQLVYALKESLSFNDRSLMFIPNYAYAVVIANAYTKESFDSVVNKLTSLFKSRLEINRDKEIVKKIGWKMIALEDQRTCDYASDIAWGAHGPIGSALRIEHTESKFSDKDLRDLKEIITPDGRAVNIFESIKAAHKVKYVIPIMTESYVKDTLTSRCISSDVRKMRICGIKGVTEACYEESQEYKRAYLKVRGISLRNILALPGVDESLTTSSNPNDMFDAFGLEMAIDVYKEQMMSYMPQANKNAQTKDNIQLVASAVSVTGQILGVNRMGIEKSKGGFITLLTFENPISSMSKTAIGCTDNVEEVASCIVVGKQIEKTMEF
ncbi:unnamed protein product [Sphagnum troendelagicum]